MTLEPDARALQTAVSKVRDGLQALLGENATEIGEKADVIATAAVLLSAEQDAIWCAGAVLEVFRGLVPQPYWRELVDGTGRTDSTLHNRLKSWRKREEVA